MEPLTSPYGSQPGTIADPVPGAEEQGQFIDQLRPIRTPRTDAQQQELMPQRDPAAEQAPVDLFAGVPAEANVDLFAGVEPEASLDASVADVATGETPSLTERIKLGEDPVEAARNVFSDSIERAKASFAISDFQKQKYLEKVYGAENVRVQGGNLQVRRGKETKFRDFDPSDFEPINDVLDFTRDILEGSIEMGGRLGGGIIGAGGSAPAGAAAGAPAGPVGATAGAVTTGMLGFMKGQTVGGAAASALGFNLGETISRAMGIPEDPNRNLAKETAVAATVGGVFGKIAKYIRDRRAAQEASKGVITPQKVLSDSQQLADDVAHLERNGIKLSQNGGKMTLSPGQIAGNLSPEAKMLDLELSTEGQARDFWVQQGENVHQGWRVLRDSISNVTGKSPEELFSRTKNVGRVAKDIEGNLIRDARSAALAVSKNEPRAMTQTAQKLPQALEQFGFSVRTEKDPITFQTVQKVAAPTLEQLKAQFPDASPATLGEFKSILTGLGNKMRKNNGALPLADVDQIYTQMRRFIDNNIDSRSGEQIGKSLIGLKNSLRDDWAGVIGQELKQYKPDALPAYLKSMENYSQIAGAQDTLRNILKKNDLSAAAFSDQIFSPTQGKDRVRQMKNLIGQADRELWPELVNHKMNLLTSAAMDPKTGKVNWTKLSGSIEKLQKSEVLGEMMSPEQQNTLKHFLNVAKRMDDVPEFKQNVVANKKTVAMARNFIVAALAHVSPLAQLGATQNLVNTTLETIGKDKALAKWLDGEGLELALQGMPPAQKLKARTVMGKLLHYSLRGGVGATKQTALTQSRIGAQSVLRDDTGFQYPEE